MNYLIFDEDGEAKKVSHDEYQEWISKQELPSPWALKREELPSGHWVSTILLKITHPRGNFETMVMNTDVTFEDYQTRCYTRKEALEMHEKAVEKFGGRGL